MIKLDCEGSECQVINEKSGAATLFDDFAVPMIFIEWTVIRYRPCVLDFISFLTKRRYAPYGVYYSRGDEISGDYSLRLLNVSDFRTWQQSEVVWKNNFVPDDVLLRIP